GATHGCWPFLLPYLEQPALYDAYRRDRDFTHPDNQPAVNKNVKLLQCPSAPPNRVHVNQTTPGTAACIDYAPIRNVDPSLAQMSLIDPVGDYQGAMPLNQMVRFADLADGSSNTLLVAEDAGRTKRWQVGREVPGEFSFGGPWAARPNRLEIKGSSPDGVRRLGPCALNCTNDHEMYSFHPGGANAVFADGSVHFLKEGMS